VGDLGEGQAGAILGHHPGGWWSVPELVAQNAHKKLVVWCTERVGRVIDFWVAFSDVVIIVRRLVREGWTRYLDGKTGQPDDHETY
jgi:hypothetical protein